MARASISPAPLAGKPSRQDSKCPRRESAREAYFRKLAVDALNAGDGERAAAVAMMAATCREFLLGRWP